MSVTDMTVALMSVADINYHRAMTRWQPDSRGRLEQAAFDLYGEHGYEQTTVAEIAARAGVTERTFFRQFADKREVLFAGGLALQELIVRTVASAPASLSPLDAIAAGLDAAAGVIEGHSERSHLRARIIAANAELQERELQKLASIAAALTDALRERGVADPAASLTAEVGVAVFRLGVERWNEHPGEQDLAAIMRDSIAALKAVAAA